jgi:uncharacterized membrane protein YsdA (DUF1294 family)
MHQDPSVVERTAVRGSVFATTHWSVILAAKAGESPESAEALADLNLRPCSWNRTTCRSMTHDLIIATLLLVLNGLAFVMFGLDKWRARSLGRRVPERTLILWAALGGWVGGLIGMNVFRHKTAKSGFKLKYALAAIPFAAEIWAWLRWR